jgi:hypothetical protein
MTSNAPPPDPLYNEIVSTTQRLFQVQPYEWQIQIIRDIVISHRSNNKQNMLVVRPTGGGKTLVYQVAGYMLKGITLSSGNLNFSFQVPFFIVLLPHIIFNRTV